MNPSCKKYSRERECIGTLEALNKSCGDFTDKDRELLTAIPHYVMVVLENSMLYEDLKLVDSDSLKMQRVS